MRPQRLVPPMPGAPSKNGGGDRTDADKDAENERLRAEIDRLKAARTVQMREISVHEATIKELQAEVNPPPPPRVARVAPPARSLHSARPTHPQRRLSLQVRAREAERDGLLADWDAMLAKSDKGRPLRPPPSLSRVRKLPKVRPAAARRPLPRIPCPCVPQLNAGCRSHGPSTTGAIDLPHTMAGWWSCDLLQAADVGTSDTAVSAVLTAVRDPKQDRETYKFDGSRAAKPAVEACAPIRLGRGRSAEMAAVGGF